MDHSRAMRSFYAAIRMIGITLGVGMLVGFMLIIVVLLTIDNYYDRSFR